MPAKLRITSVPRTLKSMTSFMAWSLPTVSHQTAGRPFGHYVHMTRLVLLKAQFFPCLKGLTKMIADQETWESVWTVYRLIWKTRQYTVRTGLTWNWCFNPCCFFQESVQDLSVPLGVILPACASLLQDLWQAHLSKVWFSAISFFELLELESSKSRLLHLGAFLSEHNFQYVAPILLQLYWEVQFD